MDPLFWKFAPGEHFWAPDENIWALVGSPGGSGGPKDSGGACCFYTMINTVFSTHGKTEAPEDLPRSGWGGL